MDTITPRLQMALAEPEDLPKFTQVYLASFADRLSHACFPRSSSDTAAWWTASNTSEYDQPASHYLKVLESTLPGRPVVAYGKWNIPIVVDGQLQGGGDDPEETPVWPRGGDTELATEFFGELARRRRSIMAQRPHCYLEIVATLPEHQRKGAAAMIIGWGCDWADREGLESYLEAGPDLVPYYKRFGFEVVDSFSPTRMPEHTESFMLRSPQSKQ